MRDCAAGLVGLGCERGDTTACWLTNRPEFHVADIAAAASPTAWASSTSPDAHLGVGALSMYPTYTAQLAGQVIGDAGCRILATEKAFVDRALEIRATGTTALQTIVCLGGGDETTLGWQELIESKQEELDLQESRLP